MEADPKVLELVNLKVIPEFPDDKREIGILVMVQIALALVNLIKHCQDLRKKIEEDHDKALRMFNRPNLLNKARLYFTIRRQCRQAGTEEDFDTIVNAILKAGPKATKEDVLKLCDAAGIA